MKPFNPFTQRKKTVEVILKSCQDCNGTGRVKDEDNNDEETSMCLKCGGSGEIVEKRINMEKANPLGRRREDV